LGTKTEVVLQGENEEGRWAKNSIGGIHPAAVTFREKGKRCEVRRKEGNVPISFINHVKWCGYVVVGKEETRSRGGACSPL